MQLYFKTTRTRLLDFARIMSCKDYNYFQITKRDYINIRAWVLRVITSSINNQSLIATPKQKERKYKIDINHYYSISEVMKQLQGEENLYIINFWRSLVIQIEPKVESINIKRIE